MGNIIVKEYTTKYPIQMIGEMSGCCWGADTTDEKKNYKRGKECLSNMHFRTAEFPDIYIVIENYSARVMREIYTHIAGGPTRLQESTRYVDYETNGFGYILPNTILNNSEANRIYMDCMSNIQSSVKKLVELGIPKEDVANALPLGMTSKMVLKCNFRMLMEMSHNRMCKRAYWEFRAFFKELSQKLSDYSEEWAELVKLYFKPKCELYGYCPERYTCGRKPKKKDLITFQTKQIEELLPQYANSADLIQKLFDNFKNK